MLRALDVSNNGKYMSFDEEFDDPFLFASMEKKRGGEGKFNEDMAIPKSIMKRLGIKSKWITPSNPICKKNGGEVTNDGCDANWTNAEKICKASGGSLPSIDVLKKVVTGCRGELKDDDSAERRRNINNSNYQYCYKKKGFTSNRYWSSTTYASNTNRAWFVGFYYGYTYINDKSNNSHVRCVRSGQ